MIKRLRSRLPFAPARTTAGRVNRRLVPLIVVAFAVIGLLAALSVRQTARFRLGDGHYFALESLQTQINGRVERLALDARALSELNLTRQYASMASQSAMRSAAGRADITREFLRLLDRSPDLYLAARYVTPDGSSLLETLNVLEGSVVTDLDAGRSFAGDPLLERALQARPGEVYISTLLRQVDENGQPLDPPRGLLRLATPVRFFDTAQNALGVVMVDVNASALTDVVSNAHAAGQRVLLLDSPTRIIADSADLSRSYLSQVRPDTSADFTPAAASGDSARIERIVGPLAADTLAQETDGYVLSTRSLSNIASPDAPLRLVILEDAGSALGGTYQSALGVFALSLLAGVGIAAAVGWLVSRSLTPYTQAGRLAQTLAADAGAPPAYSAHVEDASALTGALANVSERLSKLSADMERQRGRLAHNIELTARVARETAMLRDLDALVNHVLALVCSEYGFDHAQVFLLDDAALNAILVYSQGRAGAALLDAGLKVEASSATALGRVLVNGRTATLEGLDGGGSADGLLPGMRARLITPLYAGAEITGALDIQSAAPQPFGEFEVQTFTLLAGQLTLALESARLMMQAEQRGREVAALNRQRTHDAWEGAEARFGLERAYSYDLRAVSAEAAPQPLAVSVPIRVGAQVVGTLDAAPAPGQPFSEDEQAVMQAVADRLALALENARLFQETQISLRETSILYELNRRLNEANTLNDIVAAIITSVMPDANRGHILGFDLAEDSSGLLRPIAAWPDAGAIGETALRLPAAESSFLAALPSDRVAVVADVVHDMRLDSVLRAALQALGAAALVVVPLNVRGQQRGLILLEFPTPRAFTEQEGRIYTALIDQASVAVDNRLLLHQTEMTLTQIERLYEASRIINTAQSIPDLVRAVVTTFDDERLDYALSLLEGDPDADGWPTSERLAVVTHAGEVYEQDLVFGLRLPADSPLRREPLVLDADAPAWPLAQHLWAEGARYRAAFPLFSANRPVAIFYALAGGAYTMPAEDYEVYSALAGQMSTVLQNRRLFRAVESERQTLHSILSTMPSGVLVLDAATFHPIQTNAQIEKLLGRPLPLDRPFSANDFAMYRTGTNLRYSDSDLPIFVAAETGALAVADDIVVVRDDGSQVDLLINAAPIRGSAGEISAIVAAVEDISNLRGLENALQDNLRGTIALFEAARALAEADSIDDVLNTLLGQLITVEPDDAAVALVDERDGQAVVLRTLSADPANMHLPAAVLSATDPVTIADSARDGALSAADRKRLAKLGTKALATFPLRTPQREQPLGWLVLLFNAPHEFTTEESRFLTSLANSGAVALDNRYLFASTQDALHEASALYRASRALADATGPADVLQAVVEHLAAPSASQIFLALLDAPAWDSPDARAEIAAGWTSGDSAPALPDAELTPAAFAAWRLLAAPRLLVIGDSAADADLSAAERAALAALGARALIVLPLRAANRPLGAIWIAAPEPGEPDERSRRVFQSFMEQASLTLETARLSAQTETRARQLATSAEVSQFATSVLDLDVLLPRLVDLIRDAFGYDHVQVFLMDREGQNAVLRASTGDAGRALLNVHHSLAKGSNSVIGQTVASGQPVIALDTGRSDIIHRPNPYLPATRSELALPLLVQDQVVGALDVQSNRPNAFDQADVTVLTTLAAQIAVAIDNARLFRQSERRANDMGLLFAVATGAAAADTLADALASVAADLHKSLEALTVGIYLPRTYIDELNDTLHIQLEPAAVAGGDVPLAALPTIPVGDDTNAISVAAAAFRPHIIGKIDADSHYTPLAAAAQSAAIMPLASAAKLVGLITLESATPFAYTPETRSLLQTMGRTLSAIIQNAQLLEQLQLTNEQLRELDRVKSEFLANMSHELRTPLNSIIGFSRVILKGIDGPLTEMQEQDLTTIYNSGQHLLGLINDILDQAKIASGKMDLKLAYFDLRPVVEGVRSIGIGLVKDKPINMLLDIQSGLPQVYGDEFRTRQVLLNLVANAAKFTQQGTVTLTVYAVTDENGRRFVRVDVTDTGIGIALKDMPLLFEAFRQVDSSLTRTAGGTGMGLPISKSLVEMQGGELLVSSQVGQGSTFSVTIPTEPARPDTGELTEPDITAEPLLVTTSGYNGDDDTLRLDNGGGQGGSRDTATMPSVLVKRQVLLIEDIADRVDQFRRVIQRDGFDVFTASSVLEAEAMASGLRPSVIVMDVNFAGGQGWNILNKLKQREDTSDIPVVVATLSAEGERALAEGAHIFLQYPIVPEQLSQAVLAAEQAASVSRILIIDDQPESARLLTELLDESGSYRVFAAPDGAAGVSLVARRRPDLVILDLNMPGKDGFEVLDELRTNPETSSIPVLVVTNRALDPADRERLAHVHVFQKTDLSGGSQQQFIRDIEAYLARSES